MGKPAMPRVAWFTPLRPVKSGISLYNEELLPIVSRFASVDVFVDGYQPETIKPSETLRIRQARDFARLDRRHPFDAVIYQMGNSPAHAYMYPIALRRPGMLVLHDTMLHHLVLSMLLRKRGVKHYRALMSARYGDAGSAVAERVLRGQSPASLFEFPLSEELIDAARLIVTHSDYSRAEVLRLRPDAAVACVPMGVRLPTLLTRSEARAALSMPDDLFIVASVTLVNPYKRLDVVMRALRRLRSDRPLRFVVAGDVSPAVPLERMLALYGLHDVTEVRGFVPDQEAALIAAAADVLVNLRYPTAGETSASLLRIMAAGRPVLVSEAGSFREMPDDAVAKVPVDALEDETVFAFLRAFAEHPNLADQVGANARRFIESTHSLRSMASGYRAALARVIDAPIVAPEISLSEGELPLRLDPIETPAGSELIDQISLALVDLGLSTETHLRRAAAEATAELGLGIGKIRAGAETRAHRGGE